MIIQIQFDAAIDTKSGLHHKTDLNQRIDIYSRESGGVLNTSASNYPAKYGCTHSKRRRLLAYYKWIEILFCEFAGSIQHAVA
jgi:hypothetical protein